MKINSKYIDSYGKALKRQQNFQHQIRKAQRSQKMTYMRQLNLIKQYQCIQPIVNGLPRSRPDLMQFLRQHPQTEKLVSKAIIEHIYKDQQRQFDPHQKILNYEMDEEYSMRNMLDTYYLISILLEYQGIYAQKIFQRYFDRLLESCLEHKQLEIIINMINIILKNTGLNWVPVREIIILIQKLKFRQTVLNDQIKMHKLLSKNYSQVIFNEIPIQQRILWLFENSSSIIIDIKSEQFFNLCINVTDYKQGNEQQINSIIFHEALLKGDIYKILFRNIFFGKKDQIRLLCLDVLKNLICEFDSSVIWRQQKLNHAQQFQGIIKDSSVSLALYRKVCELFLISIVRIPTNELLDEVISGEVQTLDLLYYITQSFYEKDEEIIELIVICLKFFINNLKTQELLMEVLNKLQQNKWKNLLIDQNQLWEMIQTQNQQTEETFQI